MAVIPDESEDLAAEILCLGRGSREVKAEGSAHTPLLLVMILEDVEHRLGLTQDLLAVVLLLLKLFPMRRS